MYTVKVIFDGCLPILKWLKSLKLAEYFGENLIKIGRIFGKL